MEDKEEFYDEINLLDYINILKKHKWLMVIIVFLSVLASGIFSFSSPKIYQATAAIIPAAPSKQPTGMGAIAAQFGISTAPSSNVSELVRLLQSNILLERVVKRNNLLLTFFKKEELEQMTAESKAWNGIRQLKDIVKVVHNPKEGIIDLSAEYTDPKTAADIINFMLVELTDYMSSEAKRVAKINRKYLESLIDENSDPLIGQKIYSLIAKQIEISMMAEVKENFAFKILDPPKVPDRKIKPSIRKNIILAFIVSLFISIFMAFFIEYIGKIKKRETQETRERM